MTGYVKGTTPASETQEIRIHAARALAAVRAIGTSADAFAQLTELAEVVSQLGRNVTDARGWLAASLLDSGQCKSLADLAGLLGISKSRAQQLVDVGRKRGNPVTDPGTEPEQPVLVLAVIIHPAGGKVLMERRLDNAPPWTFPGGDIFWLAEQNRSESPAEALQRRVPQETGLQIVPAHMLGQGRIHPRTGRFTRYMLAVLAQPELADRAEHQPSDPDADLVQWVSWDQLADLAPDMYAPVRALLEREIG